MATHPYASKSGYETGEDGHGQCYEVFCPGGQAITDINFTSSGELIAGYGDWDGNSDSLGVPEGRVGVVPLDLGTGQWEDSIYHAGSEAMDVIRKINGHLYIPTTDPSNHRVHEQDGGNRSGYLTNQTGEWKFVRVPNGVHDFDMASSDGSDLWIVGSHSIDNRNGEAWARRSIDGGQTFEVAQTDRSTPESAGGGFERYYWVSGFGGKIYMQAQHVVPAAPMRVFDSAASAGEEWSTVEVSMSCGYHANRSEVFDGRMICGTFPGNLKSFDGTVASSVVVPDLQGLVRDFYATSTHLYMLADSGIYRLGSWAEEWEQIAGMNDLAGARSVGVYDDYVYLGKEGGNILKSNTGLSEIVPYAFTPEDCFLFDSLQGEIAGYRDGVEGCSKDVDIPSSIYGVEVRSIGPSAFNFKQLTSVSIPSSVTQLGQSAFSNNLLSSIELSDNITSIPNSVFSGNNIETLSMGSNVTTIGDYAFSSNELTDVVIPDSVLELGRSAFSSNPIASLSLGSGLKVVSNGAFTYGQLTSLVIPDSVEEIGDYAFEGNEIESLTLGNSVEYIGDYAFSENKLSELVVPVSVKEVGSFAFGRNHLQKVWIEGNPSLDEDEGYPSAFAYNGLDWSSAPQNMSWEESDQYYEDKGSLVKIYAADQDFINSYDRTQLYVDLYEDYGGDCGGVAVSTLAYYCDDEEGEPEVEVYLAGGHIVNPASLKVNYVDGAGTVLAESTTIVNSNPEITSYGLSQLIDWSDEMNPVLDVVKVSLFYQIDDNLEVSPLAISGYIAPDEADLILSQAENQHDFVYRKIIKSVSFRDTIVKNFMSMVSSVVEDIRHKLMTRSSLYLPQDSACQTISQASLLSPRSLVDGRAVVASNITLIGGLDFTLSNCNTGDSTDVVYRLGQKVRNTSHLRVYKNNPDTNETEDITRLVSFTTTEDGVTALSYSLIDGGSLDQDGEANGTIADPIYIGILTSSLSELEEDEVLAETGESVLIGLATASTLFVGAIALAVRRFRVA